MYYFFWQNFLYLIFVLKEADDLVPQLFRWAESSESRELRTYSMALLGAAMDAEQAHQYKTNNATLIAVALQRLKILYVNLFKNNNFFKF